MNFAQISQREKRFYDVCVLARQALDVIGEAVNPAHANGDDRSAKSLPAGHVVRWTSEYGAELLEHCSRRFPSLDNGEFIDRRAQRLAPPTSKQLDPLSDCRERDTVIAMEFYDRHSTFKVFARDTLMKACVKQFAEHCHEHDTYHD